ncbi:MAG TPA: hypothetical protein VLF71_04020 [Candidatus Saccharimonadales bacterium]|nr:hypothetical protein [Candidatus Saccharimonadales bacterium]
MDCNLANARHHRRHRVHSFHSSVELGHIVDVCAAGKYHTTFGVGKGKGATPKFLACSDL